MQSKNNERIISYLRKNCRTPLTKMSKETGIPVSTIFDRIKANDSIQKYTCLLDFPKLGYSTWAKILLKVEAGEREEFKEFLSRQEFVNSVFRINNGYDYMIEAVFKDMREMDDFMQRVEMKFKIIEKQAYFIIEDVKRESFLSEGI